MLPISEAISLFHKSSSYNIQAKYLMLLMYVYLKYLYYIKLCSYWQVLSTDFLGKPHSPSSVWFQQNVSYKDADLSESGSSLGKDFLTESDALLDKPITDINQTVSIKTSSIELLSKFQFVTYYSGIVKQFTLLNSFRVFLLSE